jgi:amino acid permease
MPFALKEAGFYGGMMLIVMVALCSDYSVRMLVTLGRKAGRKYYEDLVSSQFGHKGFVFVVAAMGIFAYGAMVAYMMGIGACASAAARSQRRPADTPRPPLQATTCPSSSPRLRART